MFTRKILGALALAAAAIAPVVTAAPATAATYPGYSHVASTHGFGSSYYTGGYVDCPPGKLAIASGSVNSDPRGMLLSGSTTTAGTGSFASGQSVPGSGEVLEVRSQCVDAGALSGFTRASLTLRDHTSAGWGTYVKKATCPEGYVAYGGGANVINRDGYYDAYGLYTHGTLPNGRFWTYSGTGALSGRPLMVEAKCLPRARLGRMVTVDETVTGSSTVGGRHPVIVSARCPAGYVAFAGGAAFHPVGSTTSTWHGYLRANLMSADDRGWTAVGDTFSPNTQLTVRVRCTDRLG